MALAFVHCALKVPLFPNEVDIVLILGNPIGFIFMTGMMFQGRKKPETPERIGAPLKALQYQPIVRSLAALPEGELRYFIALQREEWAEADKEAEISAPALIVLAT